MSESYEKQDNDPQLDLVCHVYNINTGKNKELLEKCTVLREYMIFVDKVRANLIDGEELEDALEEAIQDCITENVMREFLQKRHTEVMKVLALDYTFERRIEMVRRDSKEEGREEGRREGRKVGRKEGKIEGEESLANAIGLLKEGKNEEELRMCGFEESTIQLAISCLK